MKTGSKLALLVAGIGAWLLLQKKETISGIGAVDWEYAKDVAENELGIDFSKSYFELSLNDKFDLADLGKKVGYRRSYDNGKSYDMAFYDALKKHIK